VGSGEFRKGGQGDVAPNLDRLVGLKWIQKTKKCVQEGNSGVEEVEIGKGWSLFKIGALLKAKKERSRAGRQRGGSSTSLSFFWLLQEVIRKR